MIIIFNDFPQNIVRSSVNNFRTILLSDTILCWYIYDNLLKLFQLITQMSARLISNY